MKFSTHFFVQVGLWLLNVLNLLSTDLPKIQMFLPAKYQAIIGAVLTLISAILALVHQFYNPDGTKARVSWGGKIAVLLLSLCFAGFVYAQTPPAPVSSTFNFNVGASAFGLGGTSQATPATDVVLNLNPGFSNKYLSGLEFRSDNLLAPSTLEYFGGGANWEPPFSFPSTSVFAPLSFYVDGTVGVDRITPTTGPTAAHIGFMAGGGLRWLTSSGVQINIIEVDVIHAPGAPWGTNSPAYAGGLSYLWGNPSPQAQTRRALAKARKAQRQFAKEQARLAAAN